jgi:alkylation response protein AidB-like acyl-CoA dehydrogenase
MTTRAELTSDGKYFVINGEKFWCTNATRAGVIVVMARTPDKFVKGKPRNQSSAFIVEMNTPGGEVVTRCRFMGAKSCCNSSDLPWRARKRASRTTLPG